MTYAEIEAIKDITEDLRLAREAVERIRNGQTKQATGRHLSLAITEIENAELRLGMAIKVAEE